MDQQRSLSNVKWTSLSTREGVEKIKKEMDRVPQSKLNFPYNSVTHFLNHLPSAKMSLKL
jgi:hypothetical protein